MVVEERHSGLAKERDSRQVQNRIPQLAEGFSYQGLTVRERKSPCSGRVSFVSFFFFS